MLQCYYELHSNRKYEESIRYSFGFEGFLDNLRGVSSHYSTGNVSPATFDPTHACEFKQQYYPGHLDEEHCIKNDCDLDKKLIITGPNASGKTTMLKATTINVICSQQIGCGFYQDAKINPYTHIHSYLNIPDTSERDSLFQAESRRCKDIIDSINKHPATEGFRHYGIFDELYSGTNPEEATKSGFAFLQYLSKYDNVDFILTTHYTKICSKLRKNKRIRNHKMDVVQDDLGKLKYTYKMKKGVSKIQGAVRILEDMDYPEEIINSVKNEK
jgi:DNA mismatch repair ATPase MutS